MNSRKPCVNNNIADASFDVSKHWPSDQSQRPVSEISVIKFHKIEHVLNCEKKIEIHLFRKLTFHTRNFLAKVTNLPKFREIACMVLIIQSCASEPRDFSEGNPNINQFPSRKKLCHYKMTAVGPRRERTCRPHGRHCRPPVLGQCWPCVASSNQST